MGAVVNGLKWLGSGLLKLGLFGGAVVGGGGLIAEQATDDGQGGVISRFVQNTWKKVTETGSTEQGRNLNIDQHYAGQSWGSYLMGIVAGIARALGFEDFAKKMEGRMQDQIRAVNQAARNFKEEGDVFDKTLTPSAEKYLGLTEDAANDAVDGVSTAISNDPLGPAATAIVKTAVENPVSTGVGLAATYATYKGVQAYRGRTVTNTSGGDSTLPRDGDGPSTHTDRLNRGSSTLSEKVMGRTLLGKIARLGGLFVAAEVAENIINADDNGQPDSTAENLTEAGLGALSYGSLARGAVGVGEGIFARGTSASIGGTLLGRTKIGKIATVFAALAGGAVDSATAAEAEVASQTLKGTGLERYTQSEINVGSAAGNLTQDFSTSASYSIGEEVLHKGHVFAHGLQSGVMGIGAAPEAIYDTLDSWTGGWLPGDENFSTSAQAIGEFSEEYMLGAPEIRDEWDAAVHATGELASYAIPLGGALKLGGAGARMVSSANTAVNTMRLVPQ
jgi:hypothetical protein